MAHYAKVESGIVTKVIVAEPEFFDTFVDDSPGKWVKTSYNMYGGKYLDENNNVAADQSVIAGDEARERKNFEPPGSPCRPDRPLSWLSIRRDSCRSVPMI